jgi:hypothetical protein
VPSGALVFGAGTVQWTWGLDENHDGIGNPAQDTRLQQATLNLLADMGADASTRQTELAAATRTTDVTPPTVTVTAPAAGTAVDGLTPLTVTGTAADAGGAVGAVEVSVDGGATWKTATGRASWTYTGQVTGSGATTVQVRAADDSGNLSAPVSRAITRRCPCTVFGAAAPFIGSVADTSAVTLGTRFRADVDGWVTGVRFWKGDGNTGTHVGSLWSTTGQQLARATFSAETASGWQRVTFSQPVPVAAGTTYIASYFAPAGRYSAERNFFNGRRVEAPPLRALANGDDGPNGVYRVGDGFPTDTYNSTSYAVDPVFTTDAPPDTTPPSAVPVAPGAGAGSVATNATVQARFDEPVQPATIVMTLKAGATTVPGTTAYDSLNRTVTFSPTGPLAPATTYTVTVSGARDLSPAGHQMAPLSWTFTTASPPREPGVCPCSLFPDTATPAVADAGDPAAVELGVRFRSDGDGVITGIRFYKGPGNTGTHTGSLWSATGTRLATVTFTGESASGWQHATFAAPVPVTAGTTYVASYLAPAGHYPVTSGQFSATGVDRGPLHAPAGANGVYRYGAGGGFPTGSYNSTNYWVDVVFEPAADTTPPSVVSTDPPDGATGEATAATVRATFSEDVTPASVALTLQGPGGAAVAGTVTYAAATRTATFTPAAPLAAATPYTATVTAAEDRAGNDLPAPVTWRFTTAGACPCTLFPGSATPATASVNDPAAVELGMRWRPSRNGTVTAIRFYKGSGNTGTHTGSLWTAGGTRLATATFTNETAGGWQTVTLPTPVAVTANTTYVVSYFAPNGRYAATGGGFGSAVTAGPLTAPASAGGSPNGVYAYGATSSFPTGTWNATNYWVDVVFS